MWNSKALQPRASNSSLASNREFISSFGEFQRCSETHRLLADVALPYTVGLWSFLREAGTRVRDEVVSGAHIHAPVWQELVQLRTNLFGAANNLERRTSFGLRPEKDVPEVSFVGNLVATVAINQGLFRAAMSNKSDVEFDPTHIPLRLSRKTWLALSPEVVRSTASGQCPFNEEAAERADIWPEEMFAKSVFAHWCPAGTEVDLSGLSVLDELRDLGFDIAAPKKVPLGKLFWQLSGCFADAVGSSVWRPSPLARYADQGTLDLSDGPLSLEQLRLAMSDLDIQSAAGRDSPGLAALSGYA